ncbi:TPA: hypothetical protein ACS732_003797 [Providencia alcalifaciens]
MERKTLTLKRPTTENVAKNTEPVIQRRRKQVVVNTQRKPNKPAKATPPPKKVTPSPAKKQIAVVIPLEKKSDSTDTTKATSAVKRSDCKSFRILAVSLSGWTASTDGDWHT